VRPAGPCLHLPCHLRSPHALYQIKPLSCDPARLKGLSEKLIVSHYENNYGGAVKRLNAITEQLAALDFARAPVFTINGFKREELIATNSMILHELYFDGLGEQGVRRARSKTPLCAILGASSAGKRSSVPWARRREGVPAGCCWCIRRATTGSSTSGPPIIPLSSCTGRAHFGARHV